ncbi:energy transducer TonB [Rubrivivax sp. JA1055]|nr:energy transducer TonB [Rubrivivax sp. JA1055]
MRAEATGTTKVRFTVDASGRVSASELVRSAGPSREHKLLDRVAINKLSQCQFRPGTDEHGNAIGGQAEVEYVWNLE